MLELKNIDLATSDLAESYVKTETVEVIFAKEDGELLSLEGLNRYRIGDAVITGSTGSRWSVSRNRFEAKYEAIPPVTLGEDGHYRARPLQVLAQQMPEPFTISRSKGGDILCGKAGDWLLQYAPGDFGIAENDRFAQVYRRANGLEKADTSG